MSASTPMAPAAAAAGRDRLRYLYPGWFAVVMGLSGLALAWHRALPLMGPAAAGAALAIGGLAAAVFTLLALATAFRGWRHPEAWREDRRHPVRHTFVATLPIATLLLATVGTALQLPTMLVRPVWWLGSVSQVGVTVWVLARWWLGNAPGGLQWAGVTPALFIPIVGNVLAPLGGVPLGHAEWAAAQFGIGLLAWPVVMVLVLTRLATHGAWPDRLRPTAFIFIAPPAVVGLSALQLGAPPLLAWMCWGMALFALLWVLPLARGIAAQPFDLPHWAVSFPLAALTALTLVLAGAGGGVMAVLGPLLLAVSSLVVAGLSLATVRGLREGRLLVPEPVTPRLVAAS